VTERQVVNLCWLDLGDDVNKIGAIAEIIIMQLKFIGVCGSVSTTRAYMEVLSIDMFMLIFVKMMESACIET
jgi:hypothetical protein